MPYFVTDRHPDCPNWATVKEDGELLACHATEQDAIDQMVAVSISEDMEPGGMYEGDFRSVTFDKDNVDTIEEEDSREAGVMQKIETRVNVTDFEVRETSEGMEFQGYASVFNSRSENLGGFTEVVAPGAFTRSLKSRNDVKLYGTMIRVLCLVLHGLRL